MKLLLDYCNATGAILIAEGIETVQELECLHSLGAVSYTHLDVYKRQLR